MTSQTNQTEEADTSASVAEPGAAVASSKTRSKKGLQPEEECSQGRENRRYASAHESRREPAIQSCRVEANAEGQQEDRTTD